MKKGKKNAFISYRVSDSSGETGRLADALKAYFGPEQIFMDIDKIEPGHDFREVLSHSLDQCDILLAVMGPDWKGRDVEGNSRIVKDGDWVRIEVATALKRGIRVVPVLVDGALMPPVNELPDDLAEFLNRQAYEISNKRWAYDTQQLISFLEQKIGMTPLVKNTPPEHAPAYAEPRRPTPQPALVVVTPPQKSGTPGWAKVLLGVVITFIILVFIGLAMDNEETPATPEQKTAIAPNTEPVDAGQQVVNVNGNWGMKGSGITHIEQTGDKLSATYFIEGKQTGYGEGMATGNKLSYSLQYENGTVADYDMVLNNAGNQLSGTISFRFADGRAERGATILYRQAD